MNRLHTYRRNIAASLVRVLFASLCLVPMAALGQGLSPVIEFADTNEGYDIPSSAQDAQRINVHAAPLSDVTAGSEFVIQVDEDLYARLLVQEASAFLNGDRMIRANGRVGEIFFSLSLTVGQQNLFGHLSSSDGIRQIYAIGHDQEFGGWLYTPKSLVNSSTAFQNDYVILERAPVERATPEIESILPLKNGGYTAEPDQNAVTTADIDETNFRMTQRFSRDSIIVGSSVEVQVIFENISTEWHQGLQVEFYFMLENSSLLLAPSQCSEQLTVWDQQIMLCDLGDFAPGEKKSFIYMLQSSAESKPGISVTPIIGNLRLDSYINVVDDVRTDSDADGLSDYNESLLGTDPLDALSVDDSNTVIDVMALYTPGAATLYPNGVETRINQLISVANQVYADSGVGITLRPVYQGEVDYNDSDDMDTALDHVIGKTDAAFANVDNLRAAYGADLVLLFRALGDDATRCGLAPVGGFNTRGDFSGESEKDYAYALIGIDCPVDIVVAHEVGHSMGLTHSFIEDGTGGTFDFSTGHGVDGQFVTIMAYPAAFNTDNRIARFSDPLADCLGFACGVPEGNDFGADAVQSLNIVRHQIGHYFDSVVPELPESQVGTLSGAETDARIAAAVSIDGGLHYTSVWSSTQAVDLIADIYVDSQHVSTTGSIHVLVGLGDQGLFAVDEAGALLPWDGTIEGLVAIGPAHALNTLERVQVFDDYRFDESLVGQQIQVFIAYQVLDLGEIVYTVSPLELTVGFPEAQTVSAIESGDR